MKIVLFIFISCLFIVGVESAPGNEKTSRGLGKYVCPPNEVLVIHEQELPYALHTFCQQPTICGTKLSCTTSPMQCPPTGLNFLAGIDESSKYNHLQKTCCTYAPEPDEYDSTECFDFELTDKPRKRKSRRRPKLPEGIEKYFGGTRNKRGAVQQRGRFGKAEVYLRKLDGSETQLLIVSDISRISDGYKVKACAIKCRDTTTTQKPTTEQSDNNKKDKDYIDEEQKHENKPKRIRTRNRHRPQQTVEESEAPDSIDLGTVDLKGLIGLPNVPCFSGDSIVNTIIGPKRMDELQSNDQVMVSSIENGGPIYQPIEMWYHRIPGREQEFIIIQTKHNKLSISPNHLLPLVSCDVAKSMKTDQLSQLVKHKSRFASRATVGQCVINYENGNFVTTPIEQVYREIKHGIYSPITPQGTMIVDGIHVSCFTTLENHWAQHTLHRFIMQIYGTLERFTGLKAGDFSEFIDIPTPMKLAISLANLVLPESMF